MTWTTLPPSSTWPGTPAERRSRARRRAWRLWRLQHRRLLAAGSLAVAVAAALHVLAPPRPVLRTVWVAAADLPAGRAVDDGDLRAAAWSPASVPAGVLGPAQARGRRLAGPLRAGEPVTDARIAGSGVLTGQPPGLVATTIRVADAAAATIVQPGDRVDVLSAGRPVAAGVMVLAIPGSTQADTDPGLLGSGPEPADLSSGVLVLGVTAAVAERLSAAATASPLGGDPAASLTVTLRSAGA